MHFFHAGKEQVKTSKDNEEFPLRFTNWNKTSSFVQCVLDQENKCTWFKRSKEDLRLSTPYDNPEDEKWRSRVNPKGKRKYPMNQHKFICVKAAKMPTSGKNAQSALKKIKKM